MAIGRTNAVSGGGGGVGAVLTVTAPSGVTVEVSKDGEVKTQTSNSEGLAVFTGLETGTWTLTITDGVQTASKTVTITADYSTSITLFSATINITYPAGSTCTCSDGSTTLTGPDTGGTWACVVPNTGTWTVSCTNGTESTSENVSITTDGQSASVELSYNDVVFDRTKQSFSSISSKLKETYSDGGAIYPVDAEPYVKITTMQGNGIPRAIQYTDSIDFSKYRNLVLVGYATDSTCHFGITDKLYPSEYNQIATHVKQSFSKTRNTHTVDISNVNITGYIGFYLSVNNQAWIESIKLA